MKEYKFKVSGKDYAVSVDSVEENIVNLTVNGTSHVVEMEKTPDAPPPVARPTVQRPTQEATSAPAGGGNAKPLKSPLPGVILDFYVKEGDTVKNGQKVLLLEAMKMENNLPSPCDGVIISTDAKDGANVAKGDLLATIG